MPAEYDSVEDAGGAIDEAEGLLDDVQSNIVSEVDYDGSLVMIEEALGILDGVKRYLQAKQKDQDEE